MFRPVNPKWLSPGFDRLVTKPLLDAYELDDYPDAMEGDGNWVDLYFDEGGQNLAGRVWVNPDADAVGMQRQSYDANGDYMTRDALQLRIFHDRSVPALEAFDIIKDQYYCGEVQTGDLSSIVADDVDVAT